MAAGMVKVADAHIEFIRACIEAIGGEMSAARAANKAVYVPTKDECCGVDHLQDRVKRVGGNNLSFAVDQKVNQAANQLFSEIWGTTDIHAQTAIQKTLYELMNEALADGYANAEAAWDALAAKDQAWADANPFPDAPVELTADHKWVQGIQDDGFTKVKNKVFQQLTPDIKNSIINGAAQGFTTEQIAASLYGQFGASYLWQWQRLVRTESHRAVFTANNAEFKDTGCQWVRWSAAINRCKLCSAIQTTNEGYYKIDEVPEPPHPNCRCTTNPVFDLPHSISSNPALQY